MRGVIVTLAIAGAMIGCQTTQSAWVRVDGASGAKAARQLEIDKMVCEGEVAKANVSGYQACFGLGDCMGAAIVRGMDLKNTVRQGCMASRGYVLRQVPVTNAK